MSLQPYSLLLVSLVSSLVMMNVQAEDKLPANNYPTQARVEYVLSCMQRYGGENYTHLYGCVCAIDRIADKIPYDNYVTTTTLANMAKVPGEQGAPFRDAPGGKEAISAFQTYVSDSEQSCGLKKPMPKPATP